MTSTPPNETVPLATPPESPEKNNTNEEQQQTADGEGYHGYDPVSGLYYYADNTNPIMYFNGYTGQWLYWSEEGQYYYPAVVPPPAAKNGEGSSDASAAAGASLGPSSTTTTQQQSEQTKPAASNKVPDEDKHPLPFRLTSAIQSERERVLGSKAGGARKRVDWGAALENYSYQGFGGRSGGLGHFSNPPILPPRFYYPHQVPGSYYDFLNVRPNASVEEIEESVQWWELVGYPKALEADAERAERIHRLVMEAALIITNSSLRAQYEKTLPLEKSSKSTQNGKRANSSSGTAALDDPNYVPRVLHFHQDDQARASSSSQIGSRASSRPTSVTSTPSKYGAVGTPGSEQDTNSQLLMNTLEDEVSQPNLAERLFAAVSEGIFGPPRTRPKSKKYALRGQEWVDDERRRMMDETGAPTSSTFTVTNTSTNKNSSSALKQQQQHVDPSASATKTEESAAVKPPF